MISYVFGKYIAISDSGASSVYVSPPSYTFTVGALVSAHPPNVCPSLFGCCVEIVYDSPAYLYPVAGAPFPPFALYVIGYVSFAPQIAYNSNVPLFVSMFSLNGSPG